MNLFNRSRKQPPPTPVPDAGFRIVARNDNLNIQLLPGDTFRLSHTQTCGNTSVTTKVLECAIKEPMTVDTAIVVEVENALGLERGIGGIFGKRSR